MLAGIFIAAAADGEGAGGVLASAAQSLHFLP